MRETDTMDTFVNSSWYFLRYCDPKNSKTIFDKKKVDYWCPIDQYIGGPEHITMHLIYARFYTKFLRDIGLIKFDEPALRYFSQGIIHASDGEKMSKSRGNVIEPLEDIERYGADALRLYLVSNSSPENDFDWNEKGMKGTFKFVNRVYDYFDGIKFGKSSAKVESKLNQAIERITKDVGGFKHNLAVIKIRQLFESFDETVDKKTAESFLKMLHIYCPYVTEELWSKINRKGLIDFESWPKSDLKKVNKKLEDEEDAVSKLIGDIEKIKKLMGKAGHHKGVPRKSKILLGAKIYVYVLPKELEVYKDVKGINLFAVNDKEKHDPENKSKKVKPGRPGIYLE
jgi:leucyl-tRNA synthetase